MCVVRLLLDYVVRLPYAEAADDHVDEGYEEDDDDDDVVEDVGPAVRVLVVDVHAADHQEQDAHYHLRETEGFFPVCDH